MPKYSTDGSSLVEPDSEDTSTTDEPTTETPPSSAQPESESDPDQEVGESETVPDNSEDDIDERAGHASADFYEQMIRDAVNGIISVTLINQDGEEAYLDVRTKTALGKVTLKRRLSSDADDNGLNIPLYVNVETKD